MAALNVLPPEHFVGAVESIDLVIDLIGRLQDRGAVYPVDDPEFADLYFAQSSDPAFGSLVEAGRAPRPSGCSPSGAEIPDRPGKKHPLDCLVWRQQRAGRARLGIARSGAGGPAGTSSAPHSRWSCSGPTFDVQGGGSDLIFPHHEMCAAEGRVATGEEFARAYVHAGMVGLDGEKMSKSKGNLVFVSEAPRAAASTRW